MKGFEPVDEVGEAVAVLIGDTKVIKTPQSVDRKESDRERHHAKEDDESKRNRHDGVCGVGASAPRSYSGGLREQRGLVIHLGLVSASN